MEYDGYTPVDADVTTATFKFPPSHLAPQEAEEARDGQNPQPPASSFAEQIIGGLQNKAQGPRAEGTVLEKAKQVVTPGPIDPLTGYAIGEIPVVNAGDHAAFLRKMEYEQMQALRAILTEVRATRPRLPLSLDLGDTNAGALVSGQASKIQFSIEGKHVLAEKVLISNNSGSTIYVDFDKQAVASGSYQITNGSSYTFDALCQFVSIVVAATPSINNASGIYIRAFGNPEYRNMWGNI